MPSNSARSAIAVERSAIRVEPEAIDLRRRACREQREVAELVLRVTDLDDEVRFNCPQMREDAGREVRVDLGVVLGKREA